MGFFGFGKKNKEKEQEKMKTGLEKTRTGFWGNILNTLTGSVIDDDMYDDLEELPDEAFERGDVPMTKQEVRAAVLAKLAVRPEDILWDVGAGTGSVSVELALAAPRGRVYAVECRPEGCALIKANREKFRTRNLVLVEGLAPAALSDLPAPDAVFIGGSKGSLAAIVDAALDKNPDARICVSAIALETLSAAVTALTAKGRTVQVSQIAVSRAKAVGGLHLMMAQNPIYLITGE